jgi:hypothetical protein
MNDIKNILLTIACVVIIILCFYFTNKITEVKNAQNSLSEFTTNLQIKNEYYDLNFQLNCRNTGLRVPDVMCTEHLNERQLLSEIVTGKSLLVYRYSDSICSVCNKDKLRLEELHESFKENPELAIILCPILLKRDIGIFKVKNNMKIPVYDIPFDTFKWEAGNYDKPYYFVLSPDMKISNIYVPDKRFPELNKQYLEGIKRLLSE